MIAPAARLAYDSRVMKQPPDVVSGWGRLFAPGKELQPDDLSKAPEVPLFRGLARSYGDISHIVAAGQG